MDRDDLIKAVSDSLIETAEAHHKAFSATEGEDPDWPLWYADYLLEKIRKMLNAKFTKSELIYMLVKADKEMGLNAPAAYWPRFYATFFVDAYLK
jgi:hypothetical protein